MIKSFASCYSALSISVVVVFLAGCGGSQSLTAAPLVGSPNSAARSAGTFLQGSAEPSYQLLYRFHSSGRADGAQPRAGLVELNGTLYGTTTAGGNGCYNDDPPGCGTVYTISTSGKEKVVYDFAGGTDGANPYGGLININGTFYGTTANGGQNGDGTVFSITPSGSETVVYSFAGGSDGASPMAGLIDVGGALYGTTSGGQNGHGTVFSVTTSGSETVLHNFTGPPDGENPRAQLIDAKGVLYGTTAGGGKCSPYCGTVFSITTSGSEKVLYEFGSRKNDGFYPLAGLVDVSGRLYGTTEYGGSVCSSAGCGIVFSLSTSGKEKVEHNFAGCADGSTPFGGLINVKGMLYGTTAYGGSSECSHRSAEGTIFSISTRGAHTVLHSFGPAGDGRMPMADLLDVNGTLYGTTESGGRRCYFNEFPESQCGTVFAFTP
jgi:uncharacterized repeat protein (TIGR03803 family)